MRKTKSKFMEVVTWADAHDKERLVQKGQILESLFFSQLLILTVPGIQLHSENQARIS